MNTPEKPEDKPKTIDEVLAEQRKTLASMLSECEKQKIEIGANIKKLKKQIKALD